MRENPLRAWRRQRNLTALDVALKLGLSEQAVFSYELGRFEPSNENVERLSALMGVTESQFRLGWHFWKVERGNGA